MCVLLCCIAVQAHLQKQQLPAALAAAGQRGHLAALALLLQHPELSSRPLQVRQECRRVIAVVYHTVEAVWSVVE